MKESEIFDEFARNMLGLKAEVFTEIKTPLGICDMVLHWKDAWWCVEGKCEPSYRLAVQAARWHRLCSQPIAVFPFRNMDEVYEIAVAHMKSLEIAVASPNGIFTGLCIANPASNGIKEFVLESSRWKPEGQPFARAGQSHGKRASAVNEAHAAIEAYVKGSDGRCSLAEAAKVGGLKAMALAKLIKQGKVKLGTTQEFGKTYVSSPV